MRSFVIFLLIFDYRTKIGQLYFAVDPDGLSDGKNEYNCFCGSDEKYYLYSLNFCSIK
jgi:hypothetical protein